METENVPGKEKRKVRFGRIKREWGNEGDNAVYKTV